MAMEKTAIGLIVFVILAYGLWGFALKSAINKIGIWSAAAVGFATSIAIGIAITAYVLSRGGQLAITTPSGAFLSFSVVLATLAILATYILLEKHQVSIIMPLIELYLAIVVLLGIFVIGEKLTLVQGVGVALAIISAILLSA
jgi:bacterial/archaeal transporter family protein